MRGSRRPARTLRRHRRCVRPQIPGLSPGWSGASPHVLRVPLAGFPPVSRLPAEVRPRRPPSDGFPSSGVLRLDPSAVARFGFPFGSPPGSLPRAIFTLALPRGGAAGVGPGRQGPRSPVLPRPPRLVRPRSAHAAGGQRPGTRDAAAGSPGTSGRERMTSSRPAAIAKCDTQRWPAEFVIADYLRLARCHLDALMSRQSFRFCALGPPRAQTAQSESGVWG